MTAQLINLPYGMLIEMHDQIEQYLHHKALELLIYDHFELPVEMRHSPVYEYLYHPI